MKIYSLYKNIFNLSLGTLFASLIGFVFIPILSSYFSPSIYGKFSLYIGIITIFSSLGSLRLEQAIPLPKIQKDSIALIHISFITLFISSILFGFLYYLLTY